MTGTKPDLANFKVFGSRVTVRTPGKRDGKVTDTTTEGRFLSYLGPTDKNIYFIDNITGKVKNGTHAVFDEAHMSINQQLALIAAQALQRLGYSNQDEDNQTSTAKPNNTVRIHYMHKNVKPITEGKAGYTVYPNIDQQIIPAGKTKLIQTAIMINIPSNVIASINNHPNNNNNLSKQVSPAILSSTGTTTEIFLLVRNLTDKDTIMTGEEAIASLSFSNTANPKVVEQHNKSKQQQRSVKRKVKIYTQSSPIKQLNHQYIKNPNEPNLYYSTNYNNTGKRVLLMRQVDDFAIACESPEIAQQVINDIDSKMSIKIYDSCSCAIYISAKIFFQI